MRRFTILNLLGLTLAAVVWSGCETTVDPFIEDERYFTIFGYLDTATDQQAVRVIPLRTVIGETASAIDASVTTTELETGAVTAWTDSEVTYADGSVGHVFRGPFRPIPGYTYRFDVVRSDGVTTSATVTVPPATNIEVAEPEIAVSDVFQRILWQEIPADPFRVEVWYRFMGVSPSDPFIDAVITYGEERFGEPKNGGWEAIIRLTGDRLLVSQELEIAPDAGLTLMGVGARLTMSDSTWRPPGGVFDREILVQPGTFSNVEGGFGFLGAVNQFTTEWTLSPDITERIGYSYPGAPQD